MRRKPAHVRASTHRAAQIISGESDLSAVIAAAVAAAANFQPRRGDRVYRCTDPKRKLGTITEPGIEQSEVKWDNTNHGCGFEPHHNLRREN